MTGVQLISKKAVMESFETFDCGSWALYQGKQFIVSGASAEDLDRWLSNFESSGTTATYLLRVFDSEVLPTSTTANSDYIACISFKLTDSYEGMGIAGHSNHLMKRIGELEKRLADQDDDDTDESSTDLNSVIMGWLTDPAKLAQVAGVIRMFTGGGAAAAAAVPAAIQGIGSVTGGTTATEEPAQDDETKLTRIAAALDVLGAKDPQIVEHLEKLAKLAQDDPALFKAVISKLDLL